MNLTDLRGELLRSLRVMRTRINEQLAKLADAITAVNNKTQRVSVTVGPLALGDPEHVVITWPKEWPDTAYGVQIGLITGTGALGQVHATQRVGGIKTTTQCEITVVASLAVASVGVDVVGIRT